MDFLKNEIECPIDEEWKIHKVDLLDLKDIENGCLNEKCYYAYNIPGVQYYLRIYPYGNNEEHRGQTWIYLHINGSEERKITANFIISIKSSTYDSENIEVVYEKSEGYGTCCAKSDEFFDSSKKFFVNGEVTIGIKGVLKVTRSLVTKISSPISCEWKIKESDLLPLKESNKAVLKSKRFMVSSFSDVKYYLKIYPNGDNVARKGQTSIFINVEIGNEKNIEAVFDLSIQSANFYFNTEHNFDKTHSWGNTCCSTDDLFDLSKNFIVDGYLAVNLNGIVMVKKKQTTTLKLTKVAATQADQKKKNKDFTIVVDEKQIKVHKKVLIDASPVFVGMFESDMAAENGMEIPDFPYEIVEAAIKLCYSSCVPRKFNIEDIFLLYKFAAKYQIRLIMDHVVEYLTTKISSSNVCQFIEFSKSMNVKKLYEKCVEFLMKCAKESTPVYGTNVLDNDLLAQIFLNSLCQTAETDV